MARAQEVGATQVPSVSSFRDSEPSDGSWVRTRAGSRMLPCAVGSGCHREPFRKLGGCARARVPTELSHSAGEASMCVFQLGLLRAFEGLSLLPCPAM